MLVKVLADEQPDHIAVAFDAPGGSTFRNDLDSDVQGRPQGDARPLRVAAPADPRGARGARRSRRCEIPGVEADDVIATLATRAAADGIDVVDRHRRPRLVPARARPAHQGALQQARRLRLRALRRGRHRRACTGVTPAQYPEYAALRGDTERQPARASPASARRPRPSSSPPTATSRGSSSTSTSCRRSSARTSARRSDRVFKNREMSMLRRDVDARRRARRPRARARSTASDVRVLFNQLEFRTLLPRILEAVGDVDGDDRREADDARRRRRDRCATRRRRSTRFARLARGGERDRDRSRAGPARPARSDARWRSALATTTDAATYIDADAPRRRRRCATRSTRSSAPDGPPLVAHRAKELDARARHVDLRVARPRHRGDGVPARSRRGEVRARRSRAALPVGRADVARPRSRARSTSTATPASSETGRRAAVAAPARRRARGGARRPRARRPLRAHRAPARARCSREMEARRHPHRPSSSSTSSRKELDDECRRLEAEIHAHAGEQFNVNSTPQLRAHPVREARAHPGEEDEDRSVDRRRLAAEDGRGAPDRRDAARATARSRSCAAPTPTRCRRSSRADGRIHATFNQIATTTGRISSGGAEPAERAGAHRRRARAAQGVHRRRRLRAAHRRLLADRAARARAPRRGPGPHRRVRPRRRRAHHHRGEGVRRRRGQGRRLPAPLRQGRQLRPRVRHGGLRPRPAARHPDRSGARDPRRVLRRRSRTSHAYMERDGRARRSDAATPPRSSAAAASSPSCRPTTSASARWGSAWRRTRRCRDRRPTSSSSR